MLVGGDQNAVDRDDTHARQALFALGLQTIAVVVIERLADDLAAVEGVFGNQPHGRLGDRRQNLAGQRIGDPGLVDA